MALSTIGEGCKRQMEPLITQVITDLILPALDDPVCELRIFILFSKFKKQIKS